MKRAEEEPIVLDYDPSTDSFVPMHDAPPSALQPARDLCRRGSEIVRCYWPLAKTISRRSAEEIAWRILQFAVLGVIAACIYGIVQLALWLVSELSRL